MSQPHHMSGAACDQCSGNGRCKFCHGTGRRHYPGFGRPSEEPCTWCFGSGTCQRCRGRGRTP